MENDASLADLVKGVRDGAVSPDVLAESAKEAATAGTLDDTHDEWTALCLAAFFGCRVYRNETPPMFMHPDGRRFVYSDEEAVVVVDGEKRSATEVLRSPWEVRRVAFAGELLLVQTRYALDAFRDGSRLWSQPMASIGSWHPSGFTTIGVVSPLDRLGTLVCGAVEDGLRVAGRIAVPTTRFWGWRGRVFGAGPFRHPKSQVKFELHQVPADWSGPRLAELESLDGIPDIPIEHHAGALDD